MNIGFGRMSVFLKHAHRHHHCHWVFLYALTSKGHPNSLYSWTRGTVYTMKIFLAKPPVLMRLCEISTPTSFPSCPLRLSLKISQLCCCFNINRSLYCLPSIYLAMFMTNRTYSNFCGGFPFFFLLLCSYAARGLPLGLPTLVRFQHGSLVYYFHYGTSYPSSTKDSSAAHSC